MEHDGNEEQVSITLDDYETMSSSSDIESSPFRLDKFVDFTKNGMLRLQETEGEDNEYGIIKRSFMAGMRETTKVVAIHKNLYLSTIGQVKMEAFRIFSRAVAEKRGGNANVKYAWYGGCRDEICEIIAHGFGTSSCSYYFGSGIILSPANLSNHSALRTVEDGYGVRHMLLCRVILGNTELLNPTADNYSTQFQPSSTDFDSGVDHPFAPTKYIIWTPYMNSHIYPNHIISFKTSSSLPGSKEIESSAMKPNSPSMKMPMLFKVLSQYLHPTKMGLLRDSYIHFRENKISRSRLIMRLRSIVGDKLLMTVIKLCTNQT